MTYMTKEEIWAAALRQSAVDLNCSPEDFGREHSVVVRSAPHAGARKYLSLPFFCDLVSYGGNVVASVAPEAEQPCGPMWSGMRPSIALKRRT